MSRTDDNNGPLSLDTPIDEDRVRRALGLKTGTQHQHQQRPEQARQRHKFITDGAVPVVMLNRTDTETAHLRERVTALEATLEGERAAHAGTRRALHDLQLVHHTLQTQTRHNDMAQADLLKAEREARLAAEAALAAARAETRVQTVAMPEKVEPEAVSYEPDEEVEVGAEADATVAAPIRRARKARIAVTATKEPKPVRWWTPSYRAKK